MDDDATSGTKRRLFGLAVGIVVGVIASGAVIGGTGADPVIGMGLAAAIAAVVAYVLQD